MLLTLVRRSVAVGFVLVGATIGATALSAYILGPPHNQALSTLALLVGGALPASILVALPIVGIGLFLLLFRATRGSGVILSAYAGAYLLGLCIGAGIFWVGRGLG